MTPTQLEVTEEEYNIGSSDKCFTCQTRNYFLVPLVSVSYMWSCSKCNCENYHPCHQKCRDKISQLIEKLQKLKFDLSKMLIE